MPIKQTKTALVAGATGAVGKALLFQLLEDENYLRVIVAVRNAIPFKHHKLTQVVVNFNELQTYQTQLVADDVFCCLGTTINDAGSKEAFMKVDFDYVVNLANLCKQNGTKQFFMVSSLGAKLNSAIFYNHVKGLTEDALQKIGFDALVVVRPSLLLTARKKLRLGERIAQLMMGVTGFIMVGPLKLYKAIKVEQVAKAMRYFANNNLHGNHVYLNHQLFI